MKNIGLEKVKANNVDNFTTDFGIKVRRTINTPLRKVLKSATKRDIILESYPVLETNKSYIFASTHSFDEDIISALSIIDRSTYVLIGTTDQIDTNPTMYAAWINGMIYVDRLDPRSRKESVRKMERILNSGSSVLLFPEGGWNNTENLLVQKLFAGPYILAKDTSCEVVPISTFNEANSDEIYIRFGNPLNLSQMDKKSALTALRDELATMMYDQIEKHSTHISRIELPSDARERFMEERKNEYLRVKWSRDVWDEELTVYKDKDAPSQENVRKTIDNIIITPKNASILAPILVKRMEDKKYDFKDYMHKNWNNSVKG